MFEVCYRVGSQRHAVNATALTALWAADPETFLTWLEETRAFLDPSFLPLLFHPNELTLLHAWVRELRAALAADEDDGATRGRAALLVFLDGLLPWLDARRRLNEAICAQAEDPDDPAALADLRRAQRAFADAALGLPAPCRERAARSARAWADFVDRSWVAGLNVPPPWPGPAGAV